MTSLLQQYADISELDIDLILQSSDEEFRQWSNEGLELDPISRAMLFTEWKLHRNEPIGPVQDLECFLKVADSTLDEILSLSLEDVKVLCKQLKCSLTVHTQLIRKRKALPSDQEGAATHLRKKIKVEGQDISHLTVSDG